MICHPWTWTPSQHCPLTLPTTPTQALPTVPGQMFWAQTGKALVGYLATHWQGHGQILVSGTLTCGSH